MLHLITAVDSRKIIHVNYVQKAEKFQNVKTNANETVLYT